MALTEATLRYGPAVAEVRQFRAERYGEAAGPLDELVAPPYDVISPEQRLEYLARSPYNVVHLTLPDSEEDAAKLLRTWRDEEILVRDEPSAWALSQSYVGPDGVSRTRNGLVASLRVEPYDKRIVLPHERTHAGPKEGRLRLLRATRTQLEPIFLLHDGPRAEVPDREPDLEIGGDRLWRVAEVPDFSDLQLLIADGHHRYETALAFHEEDGTEASAWMMVVLVSTQEEGLTIFPTHRVAQSVNGVSGRRSTSPATSCPASCSTAATVATSSSRATASTSRSSTRCSRRASRTRRSATRPSRRSTAATRRARSSSGRRRSRRCSSARAAAR